MRPRALAWLGILAFALASVAKAGGGTVPDQAGFQGHLTLHIAGNSGAAWAGILSSIGLAAGDAASADVVVLTQGAAGSAAAWRQRALEGTLVVLSNVPELAAEFGFRASERKVTVRATVDARTSKLPVVWEKAVEVPVYEVPDPARVFVREWSAGAPLVAGFRVGSGCVLWLAVGPGEKGHERFPYLLQALRDLGLRAPFRSRRLWAFLDGQYRSRVDLEYFAQRWRRMGISALHVAAWQFYEPHAERDAWLRHLIEACHSQAILIYAWLELPHVSERFWREHPQWREKTALLQDAQLDWRRLMNLSNPDCRREVASGVLALLDRFDWDGVNLAELYFESLEGVDNAARFTPMNDDVRAEFRSQSGFDPLDLFQPTSARHYSRNAGGLRAFLDYRADLTRRMQSHWIAELEKARQRKPDLDLALTHVDDRFDTRMRDLIGADAAAMLPLLARHDFTFVIEDPATVWHLDASRYQEIAARYRPLTERPDKLAIDLNIVERYQDVYPTRQQTGTELFQLVRQASLSFPRVALYFEYSIPRIDHALLPAAAAITAGVIRRNQALIVESPHEVAVLWSGPAKVNGKPWPSCDGGLVWLPGGIHKVEPAGESPPVRLVDFNGDLREVSVAPGGLDLAYRSGGRAFAVLDKRPQGLDVDGEHATVAPARVPLGWLVALPRGQHIVRIRVEPDRQDTAFGVQWPAAGAIR